MLDKKPKLKIILRVCIGLGLITFLAIKFDYKKIYSKLSMIDLFYYCFVPIVIYTNLALFTARWTLVLKSRNKLISYKKSLQLITQANFINLFLPGRAFADAYRAVKIAPHLKTKLQSAGLVIYERYYGFLSGIIIAILALSASGTLSDKPSAKISIGSILCGGLLALLSLKIKFFHDIIVNVFKLFNAKRLIDFIERISKGVNSLSTNRSLLFKTVGVSSAIHFNSALIAYFVSLSLGLEISYLDILVVSPLAMIISMVPISINGLGLREAGVIGYWILIGLSGEEASSLVFLVLISIYLFNLPYGLSFLLSKESGAK